MGSRNQGLASQRAPLRRSQELNKAETAKEYGEEQVHIWRRAMPPLPAPDARRPERYPGNEERYSTLAYEELPLTESLKDTIERVNPCWEERITPKLHLYNTVLVAAHGNSLRALAMMLLHLTPDEIMKVEIPTRCPVDIRARRPVQRLEEVLHLEFYTTRLPLI